MSGEFPSTHWTEVARAADVDPDVKRAAVGRLLVRYLPAFRAHLVWRRRVPSSDVDDVLQGFACDRVVAADLIACADRGRGRFRSFLLASLDSYLSRVRRHAGAAKRSPDAPLVPLDPAAPPSGDVRNGPADVGAASVDVFDVEWARQVLAQTIERMREACRGSGEADSARVWDLFEARVVAPMLIGADPPGYAQLVGRLGFASPTQASNALVTGKRMFARMLRAIISEYAADPADVEAELDELWSILASAGKFGGLQGILERVRQRGAERG